MLFYKGKRVFYKIPENIVEFTACIDRGNHKCFVCFDTYEEFFAWYDTLRPTEKTIHEVITSDSRKLILDIDDPDPDIFSMYDWQKHVSARIKYVFNLLDIGNPNVITYDISSDDKISYHFVVSNFAFSAQTCLGLSMMISYKQLWEPFVDRAVYKGTQFIRIENSTKYGEKRWKRQVDTSYELSEGLLSYIKNATISDFYCCTKNNFKNNFTFDNLEIEKSFIVRKIYKNYILLNRIKPSFCIKCKRIHEKENAFIKHYNNKYYFKCFREN